MRTCRAASLLRLTAVLARPDENTRYVASALGVLGLLLDVRDRLVGIAVLVVQLSDSLQPASEIISVRGHISVCAAFGAKDREFT